MLVISYSCHQHISSPTSGTHIDVKSIKFQYSFVYSNVKISVKTLNFESKFKTITETWYFTRFIFNWEYLSLDNHVAKDESFTVMVTVSAYYMSGYYSENHLEV